MDNRILLLAISDILNIRIEDLQSKNPTKKISYGKTIYVHYTKDNNLEIMSYLDISIRTFFYLKKKYRLFKKDKDFILFELRIRKRIEDEERNIKRPK